MLIQYGFVKQKESAMHAVIKILLVLLSALLSMRCMCYCKPLYSPRLEFSIETHIAACAVEQIEPVIVDDAGDTLYFSSRYFEFDGLVNVNWAYDIEENIKNTRITTEILLYDSAHVIKAVIPLDTFTLSTDRSYSYFCYARKIAEKGYTYENKIGIGIITGNSDDTLFISSSPSIESQK